MGMCLHAVIIQQYVTMESGFLPQVKEWSMLKSHLLACHHP